MSDQLASLMSFNVGMWFGLIFASFIVDWWFKPFGDQPPDFSLIFGFMLCSLLNFLWVLAKTTRGDKK